MKVDLLIEAVTTKYANQFKAGSVMSNGKWYGVNKPVDITVFRKGELYTVNIDVKEKNGKTYENIVGVMEATHTSNIGSPEVAKEATTATRTTGTNSAKIRDYDAEARGKVACAAFSAALQSPGLVLDAPETEEYLKRVRLTAEEHIRFVWEHQK